MCWRALTLAWPSEWEPWLLDFCFCSVLTGVVRWSVLDCFAGPWRLVLSHTTALGSWEVRSRHGGL
jgi:hypothetical protein